MYVNTIRRANHLPPLGARERAEAAWVAAVRAVDGSPGFFETAEPLKIDLRYDDLDETAIPSRISDQDLRRYVARRLYLLWKEASFDVDLEFDGRDAALTGAGPTDFLRNLQLLQEGGYVHLDTTHDEGFAGFTARGTARLIRDVERHGAATPDIESQADYTARLSAIGQLSTEVEAILSERQRYEVAQTPAEVASVFRALAPILEGVLRRLLQAHGSRHQLPTLGPMIGEMTRRDIGSLGTRSQLGAVQNHGRDISLHGEDVPVVVLRIVTEICFKLFSELGGLFPPPTALYDDE